MQNALHLGFFIGGGDRNRTDDLLRAKQALSRLSYTPTDKKTKTWWAEVDSNH